MRQASCQHTQALAGLNLQREEKETGAEAAIEHLKLSCIQVRGVPSRFCQRCGISHDVDSFDGRKKSCRASLEKHKKRRLGKQSADGVADNSSPSTSHPTTPAATLTLSSPALEQPELGSLVPAATPDAGATGTPFPAVAVLEPLLGSPAALALGSRSSSSLEDLPGLSAAGIAPVAAKTAAGQPQLQEPQDALCVALLGELELPSLEDLESLDWDQLGCPMPGGDSAGRQVAVGSEVIGAEGGSLAEPALFSGVEVPAGALAASGSDQAAVGGEHWGGASQPAGQPLTPRHGGDALAAQGSLPTPGGSLLSSPDSQAFWGGCEVGLPRVPAVAATAAAAGGAANFNPQPTWAGQQVRAIEPTELTAAQWYPPAQQQHQQQGCLHPTAVAAAAAPTALTAPWSQACQPPSLGRQDQPQSPAQPQAGQYMSAQQLSPLQLCADTAARPAQLATPPQQPQDVSEMWRIIQQEVYDLVDAEPEAGGLLHHGVTIHASLQNAMAFALSHKLATSALSPAHLMRLITHAYEADPSIPEACAADLRAARERDVACDTYTKCLLFFKGFHAVQAYRVAHWMWQNDRREVAFDIQGRMAKAFNVDIHPAAKLGSGVLLDHATGIVIGQTSVVGDNVSMLHRVVLGGSGFEIGRRHPTIEDNVLLGAGANVLGPVTVGRNSKIGAGSMVIDNIPPNCVAVGVPAKVVKRLDGMTTPLTAMDQGTEFILDYEI
ncbi:hypothetical protein N2152v2_005627 [Parachlorella kessleri]